MTIKPEKMGTDPELRTERETGLKPVSHQTEAGMEPIN